MSDTREPEALVHDTVLEMRDIEQSTWTAEELFSVVARRMRHKLFDEYRALKRGSARTSPFDDALSLPSTSLLTPIERDKAIDQLAKASPDLAQLIELRYFEELTIPEIAKRLDKRNIWVSERTQEAIAQLRKILNR